MRKPRGILTDDEMKNMPKISFKSLVRILTYLKPVKFSLTFYFMLVAIASSIGLFPQIISRKIVDDALLGKNLKLLVILLGASLCFSIFNYLIGKGAHVLFRKVEKNIYTRMKTQLFDKFCRMDYDFYKSEDVTNIKECLTTDVREATECIFSILPEIVRSVFVFVTAFAAMGTVDYRLIIAGLAIFPLECLPKHLNNKYSIKRHEQVRTVNISGSSFVNEHLSAAGSLLMKIFTKEDAISNKYKQFQQEKNNLLDKELREGNFFTFIIMILSNLNSLLVYLLAGYLMIVKNCDGISIGSITMTLGLCTRLTRPVNSMMNSHAELIRGYTAFERILGYLDRENKIASPENGVKENACDGDIEFSHVNFAYNDDSSLLKDVSFKIPAGNTYALVGPSGAGKSSIINLIPRLYDSTSGTISFGGVNIKDIDLDYLRNNVGIVTQDTALFNGTILENLLYAKEDATMEEIETACRNANIHDFIMAQKDGYETLVGNGGLKLSGGERQRLAIARVLLKDPKILILDEATSALDSINESAIQEALERLLVGRTSIIIAHRLSTVLNADKILVLKEGQIVEQGTHKELVEMHGVYRELFDTQFKRVLEMENVA